MSLSLAEAIPDNPIGARAKTASTETEFSNLFILRLLPFCRVLDPRGSAAAIAFAGSANSQSIDIMNVFIRIT